MQKPFRNFLVLWEPPTIGVPVNEIRIIGAFTTDGGIEHAREYLAENAAEMVRDAKVNGGSLFVIEPPRYPDYVVYSDMGEPFRGFNRHGEKT